MEVSTPIPVLFLSWNVRIAAVSLALSGAGDTRLHLPTRHAELCGSREGKPIVRQLSDQLMAGAAS